MSVFVNRNEKAKDIFRDLIEKTYFSGSGARNVDKTDQLKLLLQPPIELEYDKTKRIIDLPAPGDIKVDAIDLRVAIERRRSVRAYSEEPLTLEELSWLLWATQGVKEVTDRPATMRTVPSSGARHPLETYLLVNLVEGLRPVLYRYLAIEHKLVELNLEKGLSEKITEACYGKQFVKTSAATFIWTLVPYRTIWRYGAGGCRDLLIEPGHVCQNLYLAAEAIGSGVCAITAFKDEEINSILGIDGMEQLVIYVATVGKKK